MLPTAVSNRLSSNRLTRRAFEWARSSYLAYRNNRFYTCSPSAVPIIQKALDITKGLEGDYYEFFLRARRGKATIGGLVLNRAYASSTPYRFVVPGGDSR